MRIVGCFLREIKRALRTRFGILYSGPVGSPPTERGIRAACRRVTRDACLPGRTLLRTREFRSVGPALPHSRSLLRASAEKSEGRPIPTRLLRNRAAPVPVAPKCLPPAQACLAAGVPRRASPHHEFTDLARHLCLSGGPAPPTCPPKLAERRWKHARRRPQGGGPRAQLGLPTEARQRVGRLRFQLTISARSAAFPRPDRYSRTFETRVAVRRYPGVSLL